MISFKLYNIEDVIVKLKNIINNQNVIILLQGDLASGKTTLVKKYVKSLGIKSNITSPTFSLQSIYENFVFHYDIYNKTLNEFISLGLLEEFEKDGIHFVEWANDKLKSILTDYGFKTIIIKIKKINNNKREYKIEI